ncbi:mucin-19-like [Frankliniella occidentalis]|uniref:Mucin-19-like n=1 Tax=Frankliniella occidentalis TaxID=133901 RepID=A0A9C6WVQ7_FRAOC|nr:mucin-19-like [Frankliniella occidentalis]
MKGKPAPAAGPAATTEQLLEQPPLCLTRHIKKEPSDEEIKDYAETAMNELLSWYGYDKLDRREAQNLSLRGGPGATLGALGPLHRLPPHLASALASAAKAAAAAAVDPGGATAMAAGAAASTAGDADCSSDLEATSSASGAAHRRGSTGSSQGSPTRTETAAGAGEGSMICSWRMGKRRLFKVPVVLGITLRAI